MSISILFQNQSNNPLPMPKRRSRNLKLIPTTRLHSRPRIFKQIIPRENLRVILRLLLPAGDGTDDEKPTNAAPARPCWKATVLDKNTITHPGTLFLSIERPHAIIEGKHEYIDNRPIPSGPGYMVDLEDVDIYLDIRESLTTVKTPLNALNLLSESWIATQPTSRKRRTLKR